MDKFANAVRAAFRRGFGSMKPVNYRNPNPNQCVVVLRQDADAALSAGLSADLVAQLDPRDRWELVASYNMDAGFLDISMNFDVEVPGLAEIEMLRVVNGYNMSRRRGATFLAVQSVTSEKAVVSCMLAVQAGTYDMNDPLLNEQLGQYLVLSAETLLVEYDRFAVQFDDMLAAARMREANRFV